jgi:Flp pilus assembly protein TadG
VRRRGRKGAVLSLELLFVLPILAVLFFGLLEVSLLLMGMQRVQAASSAACRVGTLPANDPVAQQQAMKDAAARALGQAGMIATYQMQADVGRYVGDPVLVQVSVPMTAASPDLLGMIGFSLKDRQLVGRCEMCKQ